MVRILLRKIESFKRIRQFATQSPWRVHYSGVRVRKARTYKKATIYKKFWPKFQSRFPTRFTTRWRWLVSLKKKKKHATIVQVQNLFFFTSLKFLNSLKLKLWFTFVFNELFDNFSKLTFCWVLTNYSRFLFWFLSFCRKGYFYIATFLAVFSVLNKHLKGLVKLSKVFFSLLNWLLKLFIDFFQILKHLPPVESF